MHSRKLSDRVRKPVFTLTARMKAHRGIPLQKKGMAGLLETPTEMTMIIMRTNMAMNMGMRK